MKAALDHAVAQYGAQATFHSERLYIGYPFTEQAELVQWVQRAITSLGITPHFVHSGGGSDANILNQKGIPTVNLAVGYENIHIVQERIHGASLVKATEVIMALIPQVTMR